MSVRTRVGMVVALGAATSLLLAATLTHGAGPDFAVPVDQAGGSDGELTYVPLEGISVDDSLGDLDSAPATENEGRAIEEEESEPAPDSAPVPWSLPPEWAPSIDPYLGTPDSKTERPQKPPKATAEKPSGGDAAAGKAAEKPAVEPDPVTGADKTGPAPRKNPVGGANGGVGTEGTDGTESAGERDAKPADPIVPENKTGDAAAGPDAAPKPASGTGAVNGGGATGDNPAPDAPPVDLPPTDVIEGIEPPLAELLPPPRQTPSLTPTPTPSPVP